MAAQKELEQRDKQLARESMRHEDELFKAQRQQDANPSI